MSNLYELYNLFYPKGTVIERVSSWTMNEDGEKEARFKLPNGNMDRFRENEVVPVASQVDAFGDDCPNGACYA